MKVIPESSVPTQPTAQGKGPENRPGVVPFCCPELQELPGPHGNLARVRQDPVSTDGMLVLSLLSLSVGLGLTQIPGPQMYPVGVTQHRCGAKTKSL